MGDASDSFDEAVRGGSAERMAHSVGTPSNAYSNDTTLCLNCGSQASGAYCAACGQKTHLHRSVRGFLHDLLHGVVHFDGKLWRTLPMLAWKPGELTRRYIAGERARFFSPIAIFLFIAFCTYIGFSVLAPAPDPQTNLRVDAAATLERMEAEVSELLDQERTADAPDTERVAELEDDLAGIRELQRRTSRSASNTDGPEIADGPIVLDGGGELTPPKALREKVEAVAANPALAVYKMQTNAYKFAWALIPLSAPFVWLLFFWHRVPMYDHIVFTTYSIAFMTALSGVSALILNYVSENAGGLLLLFAPVHLYKHLKGTYGLTRFGAFWRLCVLSVFIWIVIGLFFAMIGIGAA